MVSSSIGVLAPRPLEGPGVGGVTKFRTVNAASQNIDFLAREEGGERMEEGGRRKAEGGRRESRAVNCP
jgi:hypothetical protein